MLSSLLRLEALENSSGNALRLLLASVPASIYAWNQALPDRVRVRTSIRSGLLSSARAQQSGSGRKELQRQQSHRGAARSDHKYTVAAQFNGHEDLQRHAWSRAAAPLRVYAPSREDISVASSSDSSESDQTQYDIGSVAIEPPESQQSASSSASVSISQILAPVKADMETMNANLRGIVGGRHPLLVMAADQIFGAGGKLCFWHPEQPVLATAKGV